MIVHESYEMRWLSEKCYQITAFLRVCFTWHDGDDQGLNNLTTPCTLFVKGLTRF